MSKRTLILTAILLCTLVPFAAQATVTRVIGMGGLDANYILKDASNPSIWPQLVRDWPNYAGGEFYYSGSSWDFQKAYVNYDFGADKCALQISLDKDTSPEFVLGPDTLAYIGGGYNRLNLIWGRGLGDMKIGIGLNYASKSLKHEDVLPYYPKRDASYSAIGANLGLTALENKLDLGLGFAFASFSDKVGGTEVLKNDGSMKIKFDGRYWYKASDRYALIPNVKFLMKKDGAKYGTSGSGSITQTNFAVGLGNNWTPVENMLSIFELGVASYNTKSEIKPATGASTTSKDNMFDIYWRLGFETKIFEWLNGRLGAERLWVSEKDEMMPGKPETGISTTSTYLGATTHWNRLFLDLLVAPEFLHNGPNFVSGKTTDIFSRVSLKYDFNK
jgi:hypothetical protein